MGIIAHLDMDAFFATPFFDKRENPSTKKSA
jgi:nucleotidyltransferase/DNA polymerase involved in DNA repair